MIAVIFESRPKDGRKKSYIDLAATLTPLVNEVDGFISVERFESITNPGKMVALSFFRDEAALDSWRALAKHRAAQSAGRATIFDDYRLRVAKVIRDYGMYDRDQAPEDSRVAHEEEVR